MTRSHKTILVCVIAIASAVGGCPVGMAIGNVVGVAVERKEQAKRQLSADNRGVAELVITLFGGFLGALFAATIVPTLVVFVISRKEEKEAEARRHSFEKPRPPPPAEWPSELD